MTLRSLTVAASCLMLTAPFANAQDLDPSRRLSPMGMARTTLADDGTYISISYSRPYQRGRDNIFGSKESGALVPYGERWRTGANEATEITLTGDLSVGGEPLLAGTYSLSTVPGPERWTVHFNSALGLNGLARRDPESRRFETVELGPTDILVLEAPVQVLAENVDQFTITLEDAEGGADMCLRWITTEVCVPIRPVEWSVRDEIAAREKARAPNTATRAAESWQCHNDLEISCFEGSCQAEATGDFTPMSVDIDDRGSMSVCAYTGCWEGEAGVLSEGRFLVLLGQDLPFSSSPPGSEGQSIVLALDRKDQVATLKAGAFSHPLLCKKRVASP